MGEKVGGWSERMFALLTVLLKFLQGKFIV